MIELMPSLAKASPTFARPPEIGKAEAVAEKLLRSMERVVREENERKAKSLAQDPPIN
jgi:hypothetical protein